MIILFLFTAFFTAMALSTVMAKEYGRIVLAGGLSPQNVAAAISTVKPYAVDASSSLEQSPGIKDHEKIAQFIERVREIARR